MDIFGVSGPAHPQLQPPDLLRFWPRHTPCSRTQGPPHHIRMSTACSQSRQGAGSQTRLRRETALERWLGRGAGGAQARLLTSRPQTGLRTQNPGRVFYNPSALTKACTRTPAAAPPGGTNKQEPPSVAHQPPWPTPRRDATQRCERVEHRNRAQHDEP